MARTNKALKQNNTMEEMYKRFESRGGNIPKETYIYPREFGKQLASDLIKKIDEKVVIK